MAENKIESVIRVGKFLPTFTPRSTPQITPPTQPLARATQGETPSFVDFVKNTNRIMAADKSVSKGGSINTPRNKNTLSLAGGPSDGIARPCAAKSFPQNGQQPAWQLSGSSFRQCGQAGFCMGIDV